MNDHENQIHLIERMLNKLKLILLYYLCINKKSKDCEFNIIEFYLY